MSESNKMTVTDDRGRKITLRQPDFLTEFNFPLALGDAGNNQAYVQRAQTLLWVESIDDEVVVMSTRREVDALVQRLGADGFKALVDGMTELNDKAMDKVKNSAGTPDSGK